MSKEQTSPERESSGAREDGMGVEDPLEAGEVVEM